MKNKTLFLCLLSASMLLVGCNNPSSSSSSIGASSSSSSSATSSNTDYTTISKVEDLFETYDSRSDYNFKAVFTYSSVYHREYKGTLTTDYQYDGDIVQLTYELNGSYFTDYFYEDASKDIYTYYIDMGAQQEYQTISGDNEYYFQYVSAIDTINIANIDWEENFLVNPKTNTLVPVNDESLALMGQHIFGEKANEYWEKLEVSYKDGYISEINAISIYMETVYYFNIKLSNHTWIDIELPTTTKEYVGNQPYFYNEVYTGDPLNASQTTAVEFLKDSKDANYTVSTYWQQVQLGDFTGSTVTTSSAYADGNAYYRYTTAADNLSHNDYLISQGNGTYVYYHDDGSSSYENYLSGTDEYSQAITDFALDQLNLANLKAEDFIYNADKGYLMPKDKETEKKLVGNIFGYSDYYYGLHIYIENNKISKIETSLFIEVNSNVASYKKTYTITNIGTTSLTYPSVIVL